MEYKNDQNFWNFLFTLFFAALFCFLVFIIYRTHGEFPKEIPLFDFFLIIFATFRLTRLFVYDKITQFMRDWFVEVREVTKGENIYIERTPFRSGPLRTMDELISCPWCFGVWLALLVVFAYFMTPISWPFILILAIAGLATLTQLFANLVGWSAEYRKIKTLKKNKED